jgi:hypothetical protein
MNANMYFMSKGVVMTTNNGYDKNETPFIPLREFLTDVWNGLAKINPKDCKTKFNDLVSDMLLKEISMLPREMKLAGMKVCGDFVDELQSAFAKARMDPSNNGKTIEVELKSSDKQKVNELCKCGSGKKYKKCCK